jgi:hypothetical protein
MTLDDLRKIMQPLAAKGECPAGVQPCPFYKKLGSFYGCLIKGGADCMVMGKTHFPDEVMGSTPQVANPPPPPPPVQPAPPPPPAPKAEEPQTDNQNYREALVNLLLALRSGDLLKTSIEISKAAKLVNLVY